MRNTLLALALLFMSFSAEATPLIKIEGVITQNSTALIALSLAAYNEQQEINILIDSPGGSIDGARVIANLIQQRRIDGKSTNCYALNAMSAAFFILSFCDGRYVAPYGAFMMHYVWLGVRGVTLKSLPQITKDLMEEKIFLESWLEFFFKEPSRSKLRKAMEDETFFTGKELSIAFPGFVKPTYIISFLEPAAQ